MDNNICRISKDEINNPYYKLINAVMKVQSECGPSMPVSKVDAIAKSVGVDPKELRLHLTLVDGYRIEGDILRCPSI